MILHLDGLVYDIFIRRSRDSFVTTYFWQLKQDKEDFRVMYREGLEGTPFHTLLVEGYVDGPVDVCKLYKNFKTSWAHLAFMSNNHVII